MQESKINWTALAKQAPYNPSTGQKYRGQHLKRVADGLRMNVFLYKWLQENGIRCAKTQKGKFRSGRNSSRKRGSRSVAKGSNEGISEISEITKAIRGETYSYPTNHNPSKGD